MFARKKMLQKGLGCDYVKTFSLEMQYKIFNRRWHTTAKHLAALFCICT